MGQKTSVVPVNGRITVVFGGILNSAIVVNRSSGMGETVGISFEEDGSGDTFTLDPMGRLTIEPWDTSEDAGTEKIHTRSMTIYGNPIAPVTVEIIYTTKYRGRQLRAGQRHPIDV